MSVGGIGSKNMSATDSRPVQDQDGCSDGSEQELRPLLASMPCTRVYQRRFYVLFLFCGIAVIQNCMWNTFGPIADPVKHAFSWTDGEISLLANWGSIAYIPMLPVFAIMMSNHGIGPALRVGAALIMCSAALRCISVDPIPATWLMNAAQLLNGMAGPVVMAAPPVLSSMWFPPHQRTTATAFGQQSMNLGFAASFIIGPYIVPDIPIPATPSPTPGPNATTHRYRHAIERLPSVNGPMVHLDLDQPWSNITNHSTNNHNSGISTNKENIRKLMYIEAIFTSFFFMLAMVYSPSKPPHPPSISAGCERLNYVSGTVSIVKMKAFWLLALGYGLSSGVLNGWSSVLDIVLRQIHVSELQSGWIGFSMSLVSTVITVIFSFLMDHMEKLKKRILQVLALLMTAFFLWFLLMLENVLAPSLPLVYVSIILGNTLCQCSVPLYYELCVESTYPIPEGISSGGLTLPNNVVTIIFLLMPLIPNVGSWWMTYVVVAASFAAFILVSLVQESNRRLAIDEQIVPITPPLGTHSNSVNTDTDDVEQTYHQEFLGRL